MITFDHIGITAGDRRAAQQAFAKVTGVNIPDGGAHPNMGTHNAVTSLGADTFLELIAIDPEAQRPPHSRWFNLDNRDAHAALGPIAVVFRSDDLEADIAKASDLGFAPGRALAQTRGNLSWRFAVPEDGAFCAGGALLMMQWNGDDPHPAGAMPDLGLRLASIKIVSPDAENLSAMMENTKAPITIAQGTKTEISTSLICPDGKTVTLS